MPLLMTRPPGSLCILRLSAMGDVTHALPALRTLQHYWPETKITWVIGKAEHALVGDIAHVEFIVFDKKRGFKAYLDLQNRLRGRHFDILLHMQMSLRASLASLMIRAPIKIGFDKKRAGDMQWLFCNHQIETPSIRQHVLDSFLEFPRYLGLKSPIMRWDIPVPEADRDFASRLFDHNSKVLVINPCAVAKPRNRRNWTVEGYAAVADYAAEQYGMTVVLTGGPSEQERQYADEITALCQYQPIDLIGKTTIKQLLAVLDRADLVIAPDTGPAHIASAMQTPTIGLYAATNPDRARPYNYPELVVNRYPEALQQEYNLTVEDAPWGKRIRNPDCMALITVKDVTDKMDQVMSV